jgi:hypothetical protein
MDGTCGPYRRTENVYTILVGKFEGKCLVRDPSINMRITLKWILESSQWMYRNCVMIESSDGFL